MRLANYGPAPIKADVQLSVAPIDPADPPPGTTMGTRRRLAEFTGKTAPNPYW